MLMPCPCASVTLSLLSHHLFPHAHSLGGPHRAVLLPQTCSTVGLYFGKREAVSAFSDGTRAGAWLQKRICIPVLFHPCIEALGWRVECQDGVVRLGAVAKEDVTAGAAVLPASAENSPNPRTGAPQAGARGSSKAWPCDGIVQRS